MKRVFLITIIFCSTASVLFFTLPVHAQVRRFERVTFANLGTPIDGDVRYCTNCQQTIPCSSGGTGAFANRVNGVWQCPAGGSGDALVANPLSQFAATTSAQIGGVITNETGSGLLVFGTSPNIITPTGIAKGDVGLSNVDNTSDAGKPISTATQTALDLKAPLANPTFTSTVTIPTPFTLGAVSVLPTGTELNFVDGVTSAIQTQLDGKQPLDGGLTTIAGLTATTDNFIVGVASAWASRTPAQVKTTLALNSVDNTGDANKPVSTAQQTALDLKANLANPALTGVPTAPTAAAGTNTTQIATTAHVFAERTNAATLTNKTLTTPIFTSYTVAALPAAGTAGRLAVVTDAATAGSCTVGGGSALAYCRDSGAAWIPLGDGGGGAGTTINATDTVIPYRSNSTTFADSPLSRVSASRVDLTPTAEGQSYFRINHTDGTPRFQLGVHSGFPAYGELFLGNVTPTGNNYVLQSDGTATVLNADGANQIELRQNTVARWLVNASSHFITGADNTYDIGASGATRPRTGYFGTSIISPLFRSDSAKVLLQGTGTGATQLSATQTTVPTCSTNCGTSPSVVGTDTFMRVTMGATGSPASGWVVTFNGTWPAAPVCVVQMAKAGMAVGKQALTAVTTATTITVVTNGTAPATTDVYAIKCGGVQ